MTDATRLASITSYAFCSKRVTALKEHTQKILDETKNLVSILLKEDTVEESIQNTNKKALFIFVGPSKELCSGFFSQLGKFFKKYLEAKSNDSMASDLILIGKNAKKYLSFIDNKNNVKVIEEIKTLNFHETIDISTKIANYIINDYTKAKEYEGYYLINFRFKSFFLQNRNAQNLTPSAILEAFFKDKTASNEATENNNEDIPIFEQDLNNIVIGICEKITQSIILQELVESLMTEYSARFVAINKASSNAEQLINELTLKMNKVRQVNITKQMAELGSSLDQ